MADEIELGRILERMQNDISHLQTTLLDHTHPHEHQDLIDMINSPAEEPEEPQSEEPEEPAAEEPEEPAPEEPKEPAPDDKEATPEIPPQRTHPLYRSLFG